MRKVVMGFVLSVVLVLSGCTNGSSTEQQLADVMTGMSSAEKKYREAQVELTSLEKSEQQLFNETMKLTQQKQGELVAKVTELDELLKQRLKQLKLEESSMEKAKVSVSNLDAVIEKADEQEKGNIEELQLAVNERYEYHAEFISAYKKLTILQQELYAMLRVEEIQLVELTSQVDEVNAQNETVQSAVSLFNESTEKVNILKDDIFTSFQKGK